MRTPPDMCLIYSQVVWRSVISSHDLCSLKVHGTFRKMFVLLKVTICVFVELTDRNWPKRWMNLGVQVYQVQVSRVHLYQDTTKWSKFESFQSLKMHFKVPCLKIHCVFCHLKYHIFVLVHLFKSNLWLHWELVIMNCLIVTLLLMKLDNSKWYVHVQCHTFQSSSICNRGNHKGLIKHV